MSYLRFASLVLACALPLTLEAADLPLAVAVEAAQQAVQSCKDAGYSVTVTVLDSDLSTRVVLRADGAREATVQIAYRKAYTVVKMKMSSSEFGKTVPPQTTAPGAMPGPVNGDANLITWPGGLPIMVGRQWWAP